MSESTFTSDSVKEFFGLDSHWVSTREGERIHYFDEGQGTPVIFIHGSAIGITSAANFYLNIPPLVASGYRALGPDLYGFGWTETGPDIGVDVPSWTEQIIRFMDALKIDKAFLVGNSLGGRIGVRVALEIPDRILGNIVIGNGGAYWHEPRFKREPAPEKPIEYTRETVQKSMLRLVVNPAMLSDDLLEYRTRKAQSPGEAERFAATSKRRNASVPVTHLDLDAAKKCLVPTLIIYGREDKVGPPENALALAEALPNADLVVLAHCGHWSQIERVDEFNAWMLRFLGGYNQTIVNPPVRAKDLRASDL